MKMKDDEPEIDHSAPAWESRYGVRPCTEAFHLIFFVIVVA